MNKIKTFIIDDQKLFAKSLKIILEGNGETGIDVIGVGYNGCDALQLLQEHKPDIILMDVRMPVMDGVEATRRIQQLDPELKIMILTTFDDDQYIFDAMKNGALGYILKEIEPQELITSIKAVVSGSYLISKSVGFKLMEHIQPLQSDKGVGQILKAFGNLRSREAEVLSLVCKYRDNQEIAEELFIAVQTVKNYISTIYTKMGASSRIHAIKMVEKRMEKGWDEK